MNSQSFLFTGRGTGRDMVMDWKVGMAKTPFIKPWLDYAIEIVGVELMVFSQRWWNRPARFGWLMVGNNFAKDIMLMVPGGQNYGANFWPLGGFAFPARDQADSGAYIDVHGACGWRQCAAVFLTLYYVPLKTAE